MPRPPVLLASLALCLCAASLGAVPPEREITPAQTELSIAEAPLAAEQVSGIEAQASGAKEAATTLSEVTVSGIQPGPGLWKIKKGDHFMWVLGTLNPLPKNMRWDSTMVQARVAQSQEIVLPTRVEFDVELGFFGAMMLLPKALSAQKNPEKQTLRDLVPEPLYQRWQVQKALFFKRNTSLEKKRPILAIDALYDRALSRSDLRERDWVSKVVRKAAKRNGRTITVPEVKAVISDPKQALQEFASSTLNDLPCFEQTLARIENDLPSMKQRANAWAIGDMQTLAALPYQDQRQACANAFLGAEMSKKRGLDDLATRARQAWKDAAIAAINQHERSFGVLRMHELLSEDGIGAQLRAEGYQIIAPNEEATAESAPLSAEKLTE
jgi:hypothetical protein